MQNMKSVMCSELFNPQLKARVQIHQKKARDYHGDYKFES